MIRATMQRVPLSLNQLLERGGKLYPESEIVSRLPDKSLVRHRFADFYRRARGLDPTHRLEPAFAIGDGREASLHELAAGQQRTDRKDGAKLEIGQRAQKID